MVLLPASTAMLAIAAVAMYSVYILVCEMGSHASGAGVMKTAKV